MSKITSYSEKLKDPRWQKKRLEVMQRAKFKCEACNRDNETLHVHHLYYKSEPWETDSKYLECLCATCHAAREEADSIDIWMIRTKPSREVVTEQYRADFLKMQKEDSA
jgi:5-methylcytosine-specific restriction endonuclease McrA